MNNTNNKDPRLVSRDDMIRIFNHGICVGLDRAANLPNSAAYNRASAFRLIDNAPLAKNEEER
jgi:hypothetical protein